MTHSLPTLYSLCDPLNSTININSHDNSTYTLTLNHRLPYSLWNHVLLQNLVHIHFICKFFINHNNNNTFIFTFHSFPKTVCVMFKSHNSQMVFLNYWKIMIICNVHDKFYFSPLHSSFLCKTITSYTIFFFFRLHSILNIQELLGILNIYN